MSKSSYSFATFYGLAKSISFQLESWKFSKMYILGQLSILSLGF